MKKIVFIALFIFWAVIVAVIVAWLLQKSTDHNRVQNAVSTSTVITMDLVRSHSSPNDCWTVIESNVYNVTPVIQTHSGGSEAIISACGLDSTEDFKTKERNPSKSHSSGAIRILNDYLIGKLEVQ